MFADRVAQSLGMPPTVSFSIVSFSDVPESASAAARQARAIPGRHAAGAASSALKVREQVELTEPQWPCSDLEGERAYGLAAFPDLEEGLFVEQAAMEAALESLILGPAADDMGTHGSTLDLKGERDRLGRPRQPRKRQVGR